MPGQQDSKITVELPFLGNESIDLELPHYVQLMEEYLMVKELMGVVEEEDDHDWEDEPAANLRRHRLALLQR